MSFTYYSKAGIELYWRSSNTKECILRVKDDVYDTEVTTCITAAHMRELAEALLKAAKELDTLQKDNVQK